MKTALGASCAYALLAGGALLIPAPAIAQVPDPGPALNASPAGGPGQNKSQGAAAPNEPAGGTQLETVVVTAQKRTEISQKVAIAIATVSPETLSRSGVRDFVDITKALADVQVDDIVGVTNIAIRGVRESAAGPTSDSPTPCIWTVSICPDRRD